MKIFKTECSLNSQLPTTHACSSAIKEFCLNLLLWVVISEKTCNKLIFLLFCRHLALFLSNKVLWKAYKLNFMMNNAINNGSACSVLFLSTTGLFPARRKILEHETQWSVLMFFLSAGNNLGELKKSTEHAEPLFIAFRQFSQMTSISLIC